MSYIQELGAIAIASRLRSLTDLLVRDMVKIYKEQNIDFEPRWFTFLHLLNTKSKLSITQIAKELNQSHPAVNQVANSLEKKKIILSEKDKNDNRRRIISLSHKGKDLIQECDQIWKSVEIAANKLVNESCPDFFDNIFSLEQNLGKNPIYSRIRLQLKSTQQAELKIEDYKPEYKDHFKTINEEWLKNYFVVEPEDKKIFDHPEKFILTKGGHIIFVKKKDQIIGTTAILKVNDQVCELTKMAVSCNFQGQQAGRKLLDSALQIARKNKYQKMVLFTSQKLEKAVALYKSAGFKEVGEIPIKQQVYKRCSIQMEINLYSITKKYLS
jgi:DNA-binding MarR family transcriptional regulator/predicted GNAT family N-acyltransferase